MKGTLKTVVRTVLFLITFAFALSVLVLILNSTAYSEAEKPANQEWLNLLLGKWENASTRNQVVIEIKGLKEDGRSLDLTYNYNGNAVSGVQGEAFDGITPTVRIWYSDFEWMLTYDSMQGGILWGKLNLGTRRDVNVKLYRKKD